MSSPNENCWATRRSPPVDQCAVLNRSSVMNENDIPVGAGDQLIRRLRHPTESIGLFRCICSLGSIVLSMLISVPVLALAILFIPVCYALRKSTLLLATYCRNRHGRSKVLAMASSDRISFRDFPNVNTTAVSMIFFVFEGKLSVTEVRALIKENWLHYCDVKRQESAYPKLKREAVKVTVAGYGWKENEEFQLEDHVLETDSEVTLDLAVLNDFAMDTDELGNVTSAGCDKLWRVTVFPEYSRSQDTGVLLRMHESIAGVLPFMRLTLESLQYKTVYLKEDYFLVKRLCLYLCATFLGPLIILQRMFMRKDISLSTIPTAVSDSAAFVSFLWSEPVELKTANRIKDITRTKVEIVLISCVAGAVRSYLQTSGSAFPRDVRVCMKVDIHPPHAPIKLENQFSFVFLKLPVGTEGAVPRLWETRRRLSTFGFTVERFITWGFIKLCLLLFPLNVAQRIVDFLMAKVSCTLMHLPGPDAPVHVNGKKAKLMTIWVPRKSESGVTFSLVLHGNQVRLGLLAYHPLPCDPKLLLSDFEREVRLLAKHLENRCVPSHLRWRSRQTRHMVNKKMDEDHQSDEAV